MSLLSAVNEVCDIVKVDRFTSVYGNADPGAQTMVEIAQLAGDEIARRADWKSLLKVAALASTLPSDFQRLVPGGGVRTAAGEFIRACTNSGQWSVISVHPSAQPYYFLRGATLDVAPASAAVGAVIEYVSNFWIASQTGMVSTYGADDDVTVFPERLLVKNITWRWNRQKGFAYDDQLAEFEADLVQEINADRGAA